MGRPEAPIPATAPAKALAEYLRSLRRRAGSPGYRDLGRLVYARHNALSQTADGRYVGWARVQKYVDALNAYRRAGGHPDVVTADDVAELRVLHRQLADATRRAARARRSGRQVGRLQRMWADHPDLAAVRAMRAPTGAPQDDPALWDRLHRAGSLGDLVGCLNDLVRRAETGPPSSSWFHAGDRAAWDMLTGRTHPDLELVLRVVRDCGGTDRDCLLWESAWHRIVDGTPTLPRRVPVHREPPDVLGRIGAGTTPAQSPPGREGRIATRLRRLMPQR